MEGLVVLVNKFLMVKIIILYLAKLHIWHQNKGSTLDLFLSKSLIQGLSIKARQV